jgi:DegV family protein with EDD domain
VPLLSTVLDAAQTSLERTPDLLPVLRQAGVVDAGAKGFVHLLEGLLFYVTGDPLLEDDHEYVAPPLIAGIDLPQQEETYRFCVEGLVKGSDLPAQDKVRTVLRELGDSMIVIRTGEVLKVHIHSDDPEAVFDVLRSYGTLATHKAEDMRVQHETLERSALSHVRLARRPVSVVTDTAADLPDEVVRAHGIRLIPMTLVTEDAVYRDRFDISADDFAQRMLNHDELPTTSQPAPQAFLDVYARAAEDGEAVVAVVVGSALSGTYGSAEAAARTFDDAPVHLIDSRGASLLQGLLTLKAVELAEAGMAPSDIVRAINAIRDRSGILFTVETFDRLLASGRVGRGKALLGSMLGLRPILGLTSEGRVKPFGKAIGNERVIAALLNLVHAQVGEAKQFRLGVVHVACPERAKQITGLLRERYGDVEILEHPATPVIATHLGPGAWGVAYMVED